MAFVEFTVAQARMAQGKIKVNSEAVDAVMEATTSGNSIIMLRGGIQVSPMEKYDAVLKALNI